MSWRSKYGRSVQERFMENGRGRNVPDVHHRSAGPQTPSAEGAETRLIESLVVREVFRPVGHGLYELTYVYEATMDGKVVRHTPDLSGWPVCRVMYRRVELDGDPEKQELCVLATPDESEDPMTGLAGLSVKVRRPKRKSLWLQSGSYGLASDMASDAFFDERASEARYTYVVADVAQGSAIRTDRAKVLPSPKASSAPATVDRGGSL
jgi:hypothetical protein